MPKLLSTSCGLLFLLGLSACKNQIISPLDGRTDSSIAVIQNSSSPPAFAVSGSSSIALDINEDLFRKIRSSTPDIQWSSIQRGVYGYAIPSSTGKDVPANTIQGYFMIGTKWNPSWYEELDRNITQNGWTRYLLINVDWPEDSRWGYEKNEGALTRFLVFFSLGSDCKAVDTENKICKYFETMVFYTDPIGGNQFRLFAESSG